MAELIDGSPLFMASNEADQLDVIFNVLGAPDETTWPWLSSTPFATQMMPELKMKRRNLLRQEFPMKKLSMQGFRVLSGLLTCNPDKRLTAAAALKHPWFAKMNNAPELHLPKKEQVPSTMPKIKRLRVLSFSASKLRNLDAFSKSDPMLVVYTNIKGKLEEIGRTEVILNSLEPSWITKVTMSYQFEIVQPLMIYDIDTKYHNTPVKMLNLSQQDFLGEACCNLSEIVTKFNHSLTLNLRSDCGHGLHGTITVHAEKSDSSRIAVEMTLHCVNLENKDVFSKSDPFLRISKVVETAGPIPICKTEVVPDNLNPVWRPITLTSQQYGSKDNPLLVECFDFNSSGDHVLIGAFQTTITQLENLYTSKSGANFYSHKGQRKMKGQLFVDKLQETVQHTFLDYISSGFELNFMVAVDFTASNGDPRVPQSLHYIDPSGRPNSYQQTILGVGEVLQFYDTDRRFPAWGFGARAQGHVSHCFNLNTATNDCEVVGVEGIYSNVSTIQVVATGGRRSSMHAGSAGKAQQGTDGVGGQACWPRLADAERAAAVEDNDLGAAEV
ncbi:unnamed protein product [Miscanthus lutarioriparius]|uniref:C2 domain-containing protein n=1 Tax=Miscanthus lutarioriparius TaxID=422564 RepID=A0A811MJR2_9POAL|nr:unnamed protein product [Miscanthus lutarioriparius]